MAEIADAGLRRVDGRQPLAEAPQRRHRVACRVGGGGAHVGVEPGKAGIDAAGKVGLGCHHHPHLTGGIGGDAAAQERTQQQERGRDGERRADAHRVAAHLCRQGEQNV